MEKSSRRAFNNFADAYDRWFDENPAVYAAQLRILRGVVPPERYGLEVGVGSGRFAVPLGIRCGIDPSRSLAMMATRRRIDAITGVGEYLPFRAGTFNFVLMMTVTCFLDDIPLAFREANRVLVPGGNLIVGFLEKDGEIAKYYRSEKTKGRFLRFAEFRTREEVTGFLTESGFTAVTVSHQAKGFCVVSGQK